MKANEGAMRASTQELSEPMFRRRRRRRSPALLLFALSLPCASSTSQSSPSSASPVVRWGFPSAGSARGCRNWKSPFGCGRRSCGGIAGADSDCDRSDVLDELYCEEDDCFDSGYDCSDDEAILWNSYLPRGGTAVEVALSRLNLSGRRNGWLERRTGPNRNRRKGRLSTKVSEKVQQLEIIQQKKMRQFRKAFRGKQRQFQSSLYNLNSRLNPSFPKPPYSLWRMDDEQAIGKTTLTGKIFLLNIAMFGLQAMYPRITALGAKRSDLIMEGRQLYRLLTPVFLHGGIGHLMANSYSLKSMGINVERAFGQPRLLATYLVSGIMGNIVSAIQSPNPAVGASGAIFGLVGAYYTFLSRNGDLFGYSGQMQKSALIETIGINLVMGMTNPMIDNWGHAGGFIGGVGMAYLIGPKLYVARVPLGDDNLMAGGFGAGRVVVDRPTLAFRNPEVLDEGFFWVKDTMGNLGRRVAASVRGLLNGGEKEYYLDKKVDYGTGGLNIGNGDNTIYRTLKDDITLNGRVDVNPSDGFRQNVSDLDPATVRQRHRQRQQRAVPKGVRSIRPRYGHLYR